MARSLQVKDRGTLGALYQILAIAVLPALVLGFAAGCGNDGSKPKVSVPHRDAGSEYSGDEYYQGPELGQRIGDKFYFAVKDKSCVSGMSPQTCEGRGAMALVAVGAVDDQSPANDGAVQPGIGAGAIDGSNGGNAGGAAGGGFDQGGVVPEDFIPDDQPPGVVPTFDLPDEEYSTALAAATVHERAVRLTVDCADVRSAQRGRTMVLAGLYVTDVKQYVERLYVDSSCITPKIGVVIKELKENIDYAVLVSIYDLPQSTATNQKPMLVAHGGTTSFNKPTTADQERQLTRTLLHLVDSIPYLANAAAGGLEVFGKNLRVVVVDSKDNAPIEGASIAPRLIYRGMYPSEPLASATTASDGKATLQVASGSFVVDIEAAGYLPAQGLVEFSDTVENMCLQVKLHKGDEGRGIARVQVLDKDTRRGERIMVTLTSGSGLTYFKQVGFTDPQGLVDFTGLPVGAYVATAVRSDRRVVNTNGNLNIGAEIRTGRMEFLTTAQ